MADIFTDGVTPICAEWLNGVDDLVADVFANAETAAEARAAISVPEEAPQDGFSYLRSLNSWVKLGEAAPSPVLPLYLGSYATNPTEGPGGASLVVGHLYYNTATNTTLVYDGASWQDLIVGDNSVVGVTIFDPNESYTTGDLVAYNGSIHVANGSISPGAWDPADWTEIVYGVFTQFIGLDTWNFSVTYDGALIEEVEFTSGANSAKYEITYADGLIDSVEQFASTGAGGSYESAGTLGLVYNDSGQITGGFWT